MAYIPKHKQIVGGEVHGTLQDAKTGNKYFGKYVADFKGNYYKGESITPKSEKLLVIPHSHGSDDQDERFGTSFVTYYPKPNDKDYKIGTLMRYFVKDTRTGKIYELTKKRFVMFKREGRTTIKLLKLEWKIKGDPEDQIMNGYLYPGLKAQNADITKQANLVLPGIRSQVLKDPAQFVVK
jgi:hypothetical protein